MTEHRRRTRWPKSRVKALAWATGAATFITGVSAIVAAPKAAVATSGAHTGNRPQVQRVIVRKVIRRVVIVDPATPTAIGTTPARIVSSSTPVTASAPQPAPAPAPAPPSTTTGGS
jgi:hypothetical protein